MATETDVQVITATDAAAIVQQTIKGALVPYTEATPDRQSRIQDLMNEIDIADSNSIIFFGSKAQEQLTTISDQMLEGVRNKDVGPAGGALNEMVATMRGFGVDDLEEPGFFGKLFGAANPVVQFLQRYEDVRKQIDSISNKLDGHKTKLLTDIVSLDRLYDANLDYFHTLADYIAAGDEKLRELDEDILPKLQKEAEASSEMLKAQELRDLRASRDDLERRVHDLKLTRQVTMQSLPSIRLVQENDKALVNKINSVMANTIPLWRNQLAQAVTIHRSREAGESLKEATDLTNELLMSNAENLKEANAEVRQQIERGIFDIEAVKKANGLLVATIEESLQIADEGKRNRAEAEKELVACETELKNVLSAARSRVQPGTANL
ncbi:MAG: toxic anion resistance protein [Rhodospirillales bacterium]|nr:toxic anion resistance protein [Rhodospirillales bacterium]